MPVFNWDGERAPVVNRGFGYYWAVAVSLALLLLLSWDVATLFPWQEWLSRNPGTYLSREHETELTKIGARVIVKAKVIVCSSSKT
jgi:hypothetical protein